jgi:two-component system, sensor histidine kinase RegB
MLGMWHVVARQFVAGASARYSFYNDSNLIKATALHRHPTPLLNATRLNLQRLVMLRGVVMLSLGLVMSALTMNAIPLPITPLVLSIALLAVLSLLAWWRVKHAALITQQELLLQLLGDIVIFSMIFYYSGGYSNPFIWMYLIPITVAAVALKTVYAWLISGLSIGAYTLLVFYHKPLSHLHMHARSGVTLDIHLVGMWLGFVVSAIIVAIFITRIGQNLRDYDKKMAEVREQALESERMMALGTLAASAAHELGTPLATMAIINKELTQEFASQPEAIQQLNVMRTQILRCKEILSSITQNAGKQRAESGQGIALSHFLQEAIARWRDTRPATALTVVLGDGETDPMIFNDRTLTQALLNMLDNAADESPEQVILNAHWDTKMLTITIRDFGKGLTEETQQQLGKPFFSSKQEEGMGLGVYLTQSTLARYGGRLALQNQAEGGVLTTLQLPLAQLSVSA